MLADILTAADVNLFNFFWSIGSQSPFSFLIIFLAEYLSYLVAIWLVVYLWRQRQDFNLLWHKVLFIVLSLILSRGLITEAIRFFDYRPRPFVALNLEPLFNHVASASFPSGHAAIFFGLAFCILLLKDKNWPYYFVAAILITVARVMGGVHWPSDIVGGLLVGLLGALISFYLLKPSRSEEGVV